MKMKIIRKYFLFRKTPWKKKFTRGNLGFTLIEITLVTAMIGTLFTLLFGTYFQMVSVVDNQTIVANRSTEAMDALNTIASDLNNIVIDNWYSAVANYDLARPTFKIEKSILLSKRIDKANFITGKFYSNSLAMQSKVHHVTYIGLINPADNKVSIFRRENAFADYQNPYSGISIPIFQDIEQFKIEFSLNGENWFDQWDYNIQKSFPKFIRLTFEYKDGEVLKSLTRILTPPISWL